MSWLKPEAQPAGVNANHGVAAGRDIRDSTININIGLDDEGFRRRLQEFVEIARRGGVFQRAEEEGISELAVRKIVLRLGGEGIAKVDLLPWLDNWIEAAQRELGRHTNEDEAFEAARLEAERRFRAGLKDPSSALMDEFAREERGRTGAARGAQAPPPEALRRSDPFR